MEEPVPFLVATSEPLRGHRFPITAQGVMLGREEGCDVVVPCEGVSRQHARVLLHNSAVWVQDLGSRNGVFVNEKRVVRHKQLSPGDALLVGEQTFTVEVMMLPSDATQSVTHISASASTLPPPLPATASPSGKSRALVVLGLVLVGGALVLLWVAGS